MNAQAKLQAARRRGVFKRHGTSKLMGRSRRRTYGSITFEDGRLDGDEAPRPQAYQAHRNLVASVIAVAMQDLEDAIRLAGRTRALAWGVGEWFKSTLRRPFSFEWCCIVLDMEPERVRAAILDGRAA